MKKSSLLDDYLNKYAAGHPWELEGGSLEDISQVVIIPALAEKEHIFETLASLAANNPTVLDDTLVICVINNKADSHPSDRADNADTLALLRALMKKEIPAAAENLGPVIQKIVSSCLRLGVIDASSPGREIPWRAGGVGMARKIGMDAALSLPGMRGNYSPRLLLNLDADTLVSPDYLQALRNVFNSRRAHAGVIAYEHQTSEEPALQDAITLYEIYLRYWVAGLKYARSPYAFHSIGSTMATTKDAYLAVRGMNRRAAGEDFYFLNKLAKAGPIRLINETRVYPSARISGRVPFGTGAAMGKLISMKKNTKIFYQPRVFEILKCWLELTMHSAGRSADFLLSEARKIDPVLAQFLIARGFVPVWTKISANATTKEVLKKNFHHWFDGFETLKLINFLTKENYQRMDYVQAMKGISRLAGAGLADDFYSGEVPESGNLVDILSWLRRVT